MKNLNFIIITWLCLVASTSSKAGQGTKPYGKPFVEIQGQFVEVNERIDDMDAYLETIVVRVSSLEERVTANESAIDGLKTQNLLYKQQITDLMNLSAENSNLVSDALSRISTLNSELEILQLDVESNAEQIEATSQQIKDLRDIVASNVEGLQSLLIKYENNEDAIKALEEQIVDIQNELALKQNILSGNCPENTALHAINPDGGSTCVESGPNYQKFTVTKITEVGATYTYRTYNGDWRCAWGDCWTTHWVHPEGVATATCPLGSFMTSGWGSWSGLTMRENRQLGYSAANQANSWHVKAKNYSSSPRNVISNVICISFPQ